MSRNPKYATWIRVKKVILFWLVTILVIIASLILGMFFWPMYFLALLSLPFLYISIVISLTYFLFSNKGGNYQNKIHELIISSIKRTGEVLDIGCGSGNLIIKIAKTNQSENLGIDFWGDNWEYSKSQCEENARIENTLNIKFEKASASKLPFRDNSISNLVSCLTFHEVQDVRDKTDSIKEALRVLKSSGTFTFFDLFDDKTFYDDESKIRQIIQQSNCKIILDKKLSEIIKLPFPLNTGKVLKFAVIIVGEKF